MSIVLIYHSHYQRFVLNIIYIMYFNSFVDSDCHWGETFSSSFRVNWLKRILCVCFCGRRVSTVIWEKSRIFNFYNFSQGNKYIIQIFSAMRRHIRHMYRPGGKEIDPNPVAWVMFLEKYSYFENTIKISKLFVAAICSVAWVASDKLVDSCQSSPYLFPQSELEISIDFSQIDLEFD